MSHAVTVPNEIIFVYLGNSKERGLHIVKVHVISLLNNKIKSERFILLLVNLLERKPVREVIFEIILAQGYKKILLL